MRSSFHSDTNHSLNNLFISPLYNHTKRDLEILISENPNLEFKLLSTTLTWRTHTTGVFVLIIILLIIIILRLLLVGVVRELACVRSYFLFLSYHIGNMIAIIINRIAVIRNRHTPPSGFMSPSAVRYIRKAPAHIV